MSKAFIDKMLGDILKKVNGDAFREKVDLLPQIVTVTKADLAQGLKEGYIRTGAVMPIPDIEFENAAGQGMNRLIKHLNSATTFSNLKTKDDTHTRVVFTQYQTTLGPFNAMKKGGTDYLIKYIEATKGKLTKEEGAQIAATIKRGVERLHQGETTVGSAQLLATVKLLKRSRSYNIKSFLGSQQATKLTDLFNTLEAIYSVSINKKGVVDIKQVRSVSIKVDAKSRNFAGSEDYDWTKLKSIVEEALRAWAIAHNHADQKGSKTLKQHSKDIALNAILDGVASKSKRVRTTKKATIDNQAKKGIKKALAGTLASKVKGTGKQAESIRKPRARTSIASSPLKLMSAINAQLPQEVAQNMGSPALNMRSGRFASSVRVTEITPTAQGFPSIAYTYQKYPYQTFEPGWAQGSVDRDPRTLISRSIREIAAQYAVGRFYTRRV